MNISDFLPKYPNINKKPEKILNSYNEDFNKVIFHKQEFYENRLPLHEDLPTERGYLMKHQKIIANFMSSHTPYDQLLLVHAMGTGKTCSAIGAIEQIRKEDSTLKGVYIFAKGTSLLNNFIKELREKCTSGQYIPEGYEKEKNTGCSRTLSTEFSDVKLLIRTKKLIDDFYHFSVGFRKPTTFETFSKYISKLNDETIKRMFSNNIIVIDEVHNLRLQDNIKEGLDSRLNIYKQFHRFLHIIDNCKILLLSGTPMKDSTSEIASVMNLILPLGDSQLPTGESFLNKYMEKKGKVLKVKTAYINELKSRFKGRVSYLKSMKSRIKKKFIGAKEGSLDHFIVSKYRMSKFQTKYYLKSLSPKTSGTKKNVGVYLSPRQASSFVFPDGSYGKKGFENYVEKKAVGKQKLSSLIIEKEGGFKKQRVIYNYYLTKEFVNILTEDGNSHSQMLSILKKYSIKYAEVIKKILSQEKKCCFVYSGFVTGSGIILFSLILKLFGYSSANGSQGNNHKKRFGLLTNLTSTPSQIGKIINCFNQPENKYGEIIQVIIGSPLISEGVSLYNIQEEYILTPWFNYAQIDQAIARGYRLGSHKELLKDGVVPTVRIYQMAAVPREKKGSGGATGTKFSIDLFMYELSEDKDISIQAIIRLIMEASFDCSLNYKRNNNLGKSSGSQDCNYQSCDYKCDGFEDMKNIVEGLSVNEIDYSTYQLYYADPRIRLIREKLNNLFRKFKTIDLEGIKSFLTKDDFSEAEVNNALKTLVSKEGGTIFTQKEYFKIYSPSTFDKIIFRVKKIFQIYFQISLKEISGMFPENTHFEVLSSLKKMIYNNISITNKYGFSSYLREKENIYFLVDSLTVSRNLFSSYYSRIPNIITGESFDNILYKYQLEQLPKYIKKMCGSKRETFLKLLKNLPLFIQEIFIEFTVLAKRLKVKGDEKQLRNRKLIFEYFANSIHEFKGSYISSRNEEQFRCLDIKEKEWKDCTPQQEKLLEESKKSQKILLENNPWGYYGKFNPEGKPKPIFSIVDVNAQKQKFEMDKKKEEERLIQLVKKGKITENEKKSALNSINPDFRKVYPGKNCRKGWGIPQLLKLAIRTLKLPYPQEYKAQVSNSVLRKLILEDIDQKAFSIYARKIRSDTKSTYKKESTQQITKRIQNLWENLKDKKEFRKKAEKDLYTRKEIKNLVRNDLVRTVYYLYGKIKIGKDFKKVKSTENLCNALEKWFRNNKWEDTSLLIYDKEAGTSGGHTKKEQKIKVIPFRIETVIPSENERLFERYSGNINKLYKECYKEKYIPEISKNIWFFIFIRKKMVLFVSLDKNENIDKLCVADSYRRRGFSQKGFKYLFKNGWKSNSPPRIILQNTNIKYDNLLKLYTKIYGFDVVSNDDRKTILEFKL